jgi:hypothetical protein
MGQQFIIYEGFKKQLALLDEILHIYQTEQEETNKAESLGLSKKSLPEKKKRSHTAEKYSKL